MIIAKTIQCRDNSTRMKLKSVRPFYKDMSILEIIINRLKNANLKNIYVLTSENSPKTQEQADRLGVRVFVGDEDDVHDRFCKFATRYQPEGMIRICADNPFISLSLLYPIFHWGSSGIYDYVSYKNAMLRHDGLFCEYISEGALMDMKTKELTSSDREHVTSYIYKHIDEYNQQILRIPPELEIINMRLTVDTMDDFKLMKKLYRDVGERHWFSIVDYLYRNPKILEKMKKNIELNQKNGVL